MVRGLRLPRRTVALPRAVEKLWRRRLACSELSLQAGRVFQEHRWPARASGTTGAGAAKLAAAQEVVASESSVQSRNAIYGNRFVLLFYNLQFHGFLFALSHFFI